MLKPSIDEVATKIENRYYLISTISKRARVLVDGNGPLLDPEEKEKAVHMATREVVSGKIGFRPLTEEEIVEKDRIHNLEQQQKLLQQD